MWIISICAQVYEIRGYITCVDDILMFIDALRDIGTI